MMNYRMFLTVTLTAIMIVGCGGGVPKDDPRVQVAYEQAKAISLMDADTFDDTYDHVEGSENQYFSTTYSVSKLVIGMTFKGVTHSKCWVDDLKIVENESSEERGTCLTYHLKYKIKGYKLKGDLGDGLTLKVWVKPKQIDGNEKWVIIEQDPSYEG